MPQRPRPAGRRGCSAQISASSAYQTALNSSPSGKMESFLSMFSGTKAHDTKKKLENLKNASVKASDDLQKQQRLLTSLPELSVARAFKIDEQRLDAIVAPLMNRLARARSLAADSYALRAYQAVLPLIPAAAAVLLGSWLVPVAIRALFYYLLAPAASNPPS